MIGTFPPVPLLMLAMAPAPPLRRPRCRTTAGRHLRRRPITVRSAAPPFFKPSEHRPELLPSAAHTKATVVAPPTPTAAAVDAAQHPPAMPSPPVATLHPPPTTIAVGPPTFFLSIPSTDRAIPYPPSLLPALLSSKLLAGLLSPLTPSIHSMPQATILLPAAAGHISSKPLAVGQPLALPVPSECHSENPPSLEPLSPPCTPNPPSSRPSPSSSIPGLIPMVSTACCHLPSPWPLPIPLLAGSEADAPVGRPLFRHRHPRIAGHCSPWLLPVGHVARCLSMP